MRARVGMERTRDGDAVGEVEPAPLGWADGHARAEDRLGVGPGQCTDAGREAAYRWLEQILLETGGEYPEFVAALSMVFVLSPEQVLDLLEKRASHLEDELTRAEEELAAYPELPRLFLLDEEYRSTMLRAELAWIRAVCEDIRHVRLAWDEDWMRVMAARFNPPSDEAGPP